MPTTAAAHPCSWIGLVAVGVWAAVTLALAAVAAAHGKAHRLHWLPDMDAFSGGGAQVATQIVAVIPILATAYTCQVGCWTSRQAGALREACCVPAWQILTCARH